MTIFFYKGLTRNLEIRNTSVLVLPNTCRLGQVRNKKFSTNYVWNFATCNCENGKNLASIMDDSAISCDKIIESYDKEANIILTNFNEKKAT